MRDGPEVGAPCRSPWLWLVVGIAVLLRLGVFAANMQREGDVFRLDDSNSYLRPADSLREHHAVVDVAGHPAWSRVPGYPLFLAWVPSDRVGSERHLRSVALAQILLSALSAGMTFVIAYHLAGVGAGLLAGLLIAVNASSVSMASVIMSETLYTVLLLIVCLLWGRWRPSGTWMSLALVAFPLGLLPLIRPIALYLVPITAALVYWAGRTNRGSRTPAFVLLSLALLPATAWTARNLYYVGAAELDPTGPRGKAIFARMVEVRATGSEPSPLSAEPSAVRQMKAEKRYFRQTILRYPGVSTRLVLRNGFFLAGVPDYLLPELLSLPVPSFRHLGVSSRIRWLRRLGLVAPILLLEMGVSLIGLVLVPILFVRLRSWDEERRRLLIFLLVIVIYHLVLSSFIGGQGARYRVPMMPILAINVALGAAVLAGSLAAWRKGREWTPTASN
jgi:4-amino-4-deoxy-L-arabinose transferase-like glycosyltransferase